MVPAAAMDLARRDERKAGIVRRQRMVVDMVGVVVVGCGFGVRLGWVRGFGEEVDILFGGESSEFRSRAGKRRDGWTSLFDVTADRG